MEEKDMQPKKERFFCISCGKKLTLVYLDYIHRVVQHDWYCDKCKKHPKNTFGTQWDRVARGTEINIENMKLINESQKKREQNNARR